MLIYYSPKNWVHMEKHFHTLFYNLECNVRKVLYVCIDGTVSNIKINYRSIWTQLLGVIFDLAYNGHVNHGIAENITATK